MGDASRFIALTMVSSHLRAIFAGSEHGSSHHRSTHRICGWFVRQPPSGAGARRTGTWGARIWAKASAGTRRRLLAGSMDAGRTSSLLLAMSTSPAAHVRDRPHQHSTIDAAPVCRASATENHACRRRHSCAERQRPCARRQQSLTRRPTTPPAVQRSGRRRDWKSTRPNPTARSPHAHASARA